MAGPQRDGVGQLVQDGQQVGDLGVGVGGGELQAEADPADAPARLLIEGAILHLQADLDWLQRCQEELV